MKLPDETESCKLLYYPLTKLWYGKLYVRVGLPNERTTGLRGFSSVKADVSGVMQSLAEQWAAYEKEAK